MDETRATYGTIRTLNLQLTDADGYKRTIKIKNPKPDAAARKSATDNFVNNFILDDSKNVVAGAKGAQSIIGVTADYSEVTTINDGNYGESLPVALSKYTVNITSTTNSDTIEVFNVEAGTISATWVGSETTNPQINIDQQNDTVTVSTTPTGITYVRYLDIAARGYHCLVTVNVIGS